MVGPDARALPHRAHHVSPEAGRGSRTVPKRRDSRIPWGVSAFKLHDDGNERRN